MQVILFSYMAVSCNLLGGVLFTTQNTVIKYLGIDHDALFLSLGKHLRAYIKRSQTEKLVFTEIYDSLALDNNQGLFSKVKYLYEKMFHDKGMDEHFNLELAKQYIARHGLCIGIAYTETQVPLGFSAIIHDKNSARLWLTAFDFRNEQLDAQVLSRAHQRLDYELLCWCNDKGITRFDFGGINSFEAPNGIAQFKLKFESNNRVVLNNYLVPNSLFGKLMLKLYLWRKR